MLPYLIIFIVLILAFTGLILLKFFKFTNREFTMMVKLLGCTDIILCILEIYLFVTVNMGLFMIGLVIILFYIFVTAFNMKK